MTIPYRRICLALAVLVAGALPAGAGAAGTPALIKAEEVGYFGSATVTHSLTVFVYSNVGPAAGNHITVCHAGKCEPAHGHNASLAWYAATFKIRGLRMGDTVRFTVHASDGARQSQAQVSDQLLCMHNNGSTPQS